MKKRVLVDELLDHLPADDPDAIRSRRDLRLINLAMGNFAWIESELRKLKVLDGSAHIVELGAGDGTFAKWLVERNPEVKFSSLDLVARPAELPEKIGWHQGDAFELLDKIEGEVLIANLFLHHFTDEQLGQLGELAKNYQAIISNEPARMKIFHGLAFAGRVLGFNHVTRHDIHVSIDAGFVGAELSESLGLAGWRHEVKHTVTGSHRLVATRPLEN